MRNITVMLILISVFCSCSSSFVKRIDQEQISLKSLDNEAVTIGFENDKSLVRFERSDVIDLFKNENPDFTTQQRINKIERLEKIEADSLLPLSKSSTESWEMEIKFHDLLVQGKAEVFNKQSGEFVERIGYEKTVDKLGGVQVAYSFMDGTVFYSSILKLGE